MILVGLATFFPILVTTLDGLRSVDPEAVKMMRTLDASRWAIFRRVEVPTALPAFFSGLKVAAAIAPIVALFAELVGSSSGLMHQIVTDNASLEVARDVRGGRDPDGDRAPPLRPLALAERLVVSWR